MWKLGRESCENWADISLLLKFYLNKRKILERIEQKLGHILNLNKRSGTGSLIRFAPFCFLTIIMQREKTSKDKKNEVENITHNR